jgi:hypothetical protein
MRQFVQYCVPFTYELFLGSHVSFLDESMFVSPHGIVTHLLLWHIWFSPVQSPLPMQSTHWPEEVHFFDPPQEVPCGFVPDTQRPP